MTPARSPASSPPPPRPIELLLVALDDARRAGADRVGVLARVPAGPALAQQVPRLIKLDLELGQANGLVRAQCVRRLTLERVLLGNQIVDVLQDLAVIHVDLLGR